MGYILGGANVGQRYGVTNGSAPASVSEVVDMISYASELGFTRIDTARSYGDSEEILGKACNLDMKISSKFAMPPDQTHNENIVFEFIRDQLNVTLDHLSAGKGDLDSYLLHDVTTCSTEQLSYVDSAFQRLKQCYPEIRFGVSLYSRSDFDRVANFKLLEIVQRPSNILARTSFGLSKKVMAERGIEVHSRSIFLQGLLLIDLEHIPATLIHMRPAIEQFHEYCNKLGSDPYSVCLAYASQSHISDHVVVGCRSSKDLDDFSAATAVELPCEIVSFISNEDELDPRKWPSI